MNSDVKTRFLIISDTHSMDFPPETIPLQHADVALHCGDLTEGSKIEEFQAALRLLRNINAPIKLVIAGNHDFTLDTPNFMDKVSQVKQHIGHDLIKKDYGDYGEAEQLLKEAANEGIVFLKEGTHRFTLNNGASLTVYASPYTPSLGDWGFQYRHGNHDFAINRNVDVVMTHGPPKGVLDYTLSHQRAGCENLFGAVARSRPRLHCFGHIHEGWGAKLATWRDEISESPSHFTDIDNDKSVLVDKLSTIHGSKFDTPETLEEKRKKLEKHSNERCYMASYCTGDTNPLKHGSQTLFVNASIQGIDEDYPYHLPWLIDLELPKADG